MVKDDKIVWIKNPSDFNGFSLRHNHKENVFDVFGLLKSSGGKEVWIKCGTAVIEGYDLGLIKNNAKVIIGSLLVCLPLLLVFVWLY